MQRPVRPSWIIGRNIDENVCVDQWSDSEVRQCSGLVQMRTSESKDHWQLYDSSAVLNLKFLNELAASTDRNFKFTALASSRRTAGERHDLVRREPACCGPSHPKEAASRHPAFATPAEKCPPILADVELYLAPRLDAEAIPNRFWDGHLPLARYRHAHGSLRNTSATTGIT
jgi:hypothetical protein